MKPTGLQNLPIAQSCPVGVPVLHSDINSTQASPDIFWKLLTGKELLKGKRIITVVVSCLHIKTMQLMRTQVKGKKSAHYLCDEAISNATPHLLPPVF